MNSFEMTFWNFYSKNKQSSAKALQSERKIRQLLERNVEREMKKNAAKNGRLKITSCIERALIYHRKVSGSLKILDFMVKTAPLVLSSCSRNIHRFLKFKISRE